MFSRIMEKKGQESLQKVFGVISGKDEKSVTVSIEQNEIVQVPINQIEIAFPFGIGDYVKVEMNVKSKESEGMEFWSLKEGRCKVTRIEEKMTMINEEICYFSTVDDEGVALEIGAVGVCKYIEGEYRGQNGEIQWRCVSFCMEKSASKPKKKSVFDWVEQVEIATSSEKADSEPHAVKQAKQRSKYRSEHFNVPDEFYELIMGEKQTRVSEELQKFMIPRGDLNFGNYCEYFHNLLYLEEMELVKSFAEYDKESAYFKPNDKGLYLLDCDNVYEMRPSLAIGKGS